MNRFGGVPVTLSDPPPGVVVNGGTPGGAAGGSLSGTYPNPVLATGVVTDNEVAAGAAIQLSKLAVEIPAGATPVMPVWVRRTADSAGLTSQATPQNDNTLLWAVLANEVWFFEAFLLFNAANTTMDIKLGLSTPAGTTASWGALGAPGQNNPGYGAAQTTNTPIQINGAAGLPAYGSAAAVTIGLSVGGVIVVGGTAGTVNLQWSQNTSDAGALVLKANSLLRLSKLA